MRHRCNARAVTECCYALFKAPSPLPPDALWQTLHYKATDRYNIAMTMLANLHTSVTPATSMRWCPGCSACGRPPSAWASPTLTWSSCTVSVLGAAQRLLACHVCASKELLWMTSGVHCCLLPMIDGVMPLGTKCVPDPSHCTRIRQYRHAFP